MNDTKKYINRAKDIIEEQNLQKYVDILLNYWAEYPPELGHGVHHAISVAVEAYDLGLENNYDQPEDLFLGGLFHDIYRPTESGTGEEDQTKGARITKELLDKNSVEDKLVSKIYNMILSHDEWRGAENPPQFDLLVSIADKICMSFYHSDTYVWSVNQNQLRKGKEPIMTSHFNNTYLWLRYQKRA